MTKKKTIKSRDYLMKRLIEGATKSGVHTDRKKEANKQEARQKVETSSRCKQCGYPLYEEAEGHPGFCSPSCKEYSGCEEYTE